MVKFAGNMELYDSIITSTLMLKEAVRKTLDLAESALQVIPNFSDTELYCLQSVPSGIRL
jgi:hypothetical protein